VTRVQFLTGAWRDLAKVVHFVQLFEL
jgi:hypothetical protein